MSKPRRSVYVSANPRSKCSEESTEYTKSNALMLTDISSSSCDISMNICSDTSLQNSPSLCKPTIAAVPTVGHLQPMDISQLSSMMDVSMSDASTAAPPVGAPKSQAKFQCSVLLSPLNVIHKEEAAEAFDLSMGIDDGCYGAKPDPELKVQDSSRLSNCHKTTTTSPPLKSVNFDGPSIMGITDQYTQISPLTNCQDSVPIHLEDQVMTDQSDLVPNSSPSNVRPTTSAHQTACFRITETPKVQKTPVPVSSHLTSMHPHVWSIPPLKSDQSLWNSVPSRPSKKRMLITQSATRWDYRIQRKSHVSNEGGDDTAQFKADEDRQLSGPHSLSLNTTPIRRIGPRIDWFEAAKEHNPDMSTSFLKNSFTSQISPLLNIKNLPLPALPVELKDLCRAPREFTEMDEILHDKQLEGEKVKIDHDTWWLKSSNHRSRADSLLGSNRLLFYGKLCLDRQKAVLETCPTARLTEKLNVMDCYGGAMETLKRCTLETVQELMELKEDRSKARQSHLQDQTDFLRQIDAQLACEFEQLQDELTSVNSEISEWEKFALDDKENCGGTVSDLDNQLTEVTEQVKQVDLQLKEAVEASKLDGSQSKQRQNLLLSSVGCTELFVPSRALIPGNHVDANDTENLFQMEELVNLLSPSRLECLDYGKHKYQVTCLLGHLAFISTCCLCPSPTNDRSLVSTSTVAGTTDHWAWHAPEDLMVETVSVTSPDIVTCSNDCPAVEKLARFLIDLLNSQLNSSACLPSKLVGMSLTEAIDYLDFVLLPYLLLGCDLRAIYLRGHSVEFSMLNHGATEISRSSNQLLPGTPQALSTLLTAPEFECLSGLVNKFPSLDQIDLLHPILAVKIQALLAEQEIRLGQLHRIVSVLEDSLSSNMC